MSFASANAVLREKVCYVYNFEYSNDRIYWYNNAVKHSKSNYWKITPESAILPAKGDKKNLIQEPQKIKLRI